MWRTDNGRHYRVNITETQIGSEADDQGESILGYVCVRVLISINSEGWSASQKLVHQHTEAPPVHRLQRTEAPNSDFSLESVQLDLIK